MMSSPTGTNKLLASILLVGVLAIASMAITTVPSAAFAQTATDQSDDSTANSSQDQNVAINPLDNSTATTDQGNNNTTSTENNNNTSATEAQSDNSSTEITGTIKVNENQTADDFNADILAVPEENATQTATAQVTNGTVVDSQLDVVQGFLVYTVTVADIANHNIYHVIVDPGDGSVLYTSPGIPVGNSVIQEIMDENGISSDDNNNDDSG